MVLDVSYQKELDAICFARVTLRNTIVSLDASMVLDLLTNLLFVRDQWIVSLVHTLAVKKSRKGLFYCRGSPLRKKSPSYSGACDAVDSWGTYLEQRWKDSTVGSKEYYDLMTEMEKLEKQ